MRKLAGVRDFGAGYRPHLARRDRHDRGCLTRQGYELDLIRLVLRIYVDDGADVPRFERLAWKWRRQHNSIVLADHDFNILKRMGSY